MKRPTGAACAALLMLGVALTACAENGKTQASGASQKPSADADKVGTIKDVQPMSTFCGKKKITVAYVDSNAGANSWRKITHAELLDEAAKCPNVVKVISTDGQGSLQKTITDLNAVTAQRVDAIVLMFADFGKDLLPAARQAQRSGIPVAGILGAGIGGTPGTDYVANVYADEVRDAKKRVAWLSKVMGGKGNIIHIGGTPGNPLSKAVFSGIEAQLTVDKGLKLLVDHPIDTNFSPADEQKALAGVLAKYPKIDGVQNECGTCAPGGFRAFKAAERSLVPWTSDDNNEVACDYYELKKKNPGFEILTTAARTWLSRVALHAAVAKAQGIDSTEPQVYTMPVVEDSTDPKRQPKCDRDAPPGAIFSSLLSDEKVIAAVK